MGVNIRRASVEDAQAIVNLMMLAWGEKPSMQTIQQFLLVDNHITQVAEVNRAVVGFVDGFMTIAQDGILRWELDLVVVHPDFRGQGLAKKLIEQNTALGFVEDADMARALVRVDNFPVHRVFEYCSYDLQETTCQLYVHSEKTVQVDLQKYSNGYLLSVATLNYTGVWIEGEISENSIQSALMARNLHDYDVVGVVLPAHAKKARNLLITHDFAFIGDYYWCVKPQ